MSAISQKDLATLKVALMERTEALMRIQLCEMEFEFALAKHDATRILELYDELTAALHNYKAKSLKYRDISERLRQCPKAKA